MGLLTKQLLNEFIKQGNTDFLEAEKIRIIVKYFNPGFNGIWYATEYDPQTRRFLGFVELDPTDPTEAGIGYFSIDELAGYVNPDGEKIKRDQDFGTHFLSELLNGQRP